MSATDFFFFLSKVTTQKRIYIVSHSVPILGFVALCTTHLLSCLCPGPDHLLCGAGTLLVTSLCPPTVSAAPCLEIS